MSKFIGTWTGCDCLLSDTTVNPPEARVTEKDDQLASRKTITDVLSEGFLPARPATHVMGQGRASDLAEEDVTKVAGKN